MAATLTPKAIDEAYRRHGAAVFRRARALLGNENDARELVQEIFFALVDDPAQFKGASSLTTWLYSATTHRCLNRIRDHKNRSRLLEVQVAPAQARAEDSRAEVSAVLRQVLERLPTDLAQVAVYFHLDEMTHEEIAEVIGCSRRHVGNLLVRLAAAVPREEAST